MSFSQGDSHSRWRRSPGTVDWPFVYYSVQGSHLMPTLFSEIVGSALARKIGDYLSPNKGFLRFLPMTLPLLTEGSRCVPKLKDPVREVTAVLIVPVTATAKLWAPLNVTVLVCGFKNLAFSAS